MTNQCKCPRCGHDHPFRPHAEKEIYSSEQRIALFIDGGNLYHAAKKLGFKVDYHRLKEYFVPPGKELYKAFYYTASDSSQAFIMRIIDWLRHNGFEVTTKEVKGFGSSMKGNLDIELAIDTLKHEDHYDLAIIFSGDGDFTYCVKELQKRGKTVHVVSTEQTKPSLLSREIKEQADSVIELADIIPSISK